MERAREKRRFYRPPGAPLCPPESSRKPENQEAKPGAHQTVEPDLAVLQADELRHHTAPCRRHEQRQGAFENQCRTQCSPKQIIHRDRTRSGSLPPRCPQDATRQARRLCAMQRVERHTSRPSPATDAAKPTRRGPSLRTQRAGLKPLLKSLRNCEDAGSTTRKSPFCPMLSLYAPRLR